MASLDVDKVWVQDDAEGWRLAKVVSSTEDALVVEEASGDSQREISIDETETYDRSHDDSSLDDIYTMGDMNEAGLLHLLKQRSMMDKIYTYIGDVLISVNPYHRVEDEKFLNDVADRVYRDLLRNGFRGKSQSVLVSGESGAGKTEAAKRVMAHLASASQRRRKSLAGKKPRASFRVVGLFGKRGAPKLGRSSITGSNRSSQSGTPVTELETSIVETNPVLEAFGNAQTVRNDNSSRFGKFVRLDYNKDGVIVGARTQHFLLEKSRLTMQSPGERNYHIFYQFLEGAANGLVPENVIPDGLEVSCWEDYRYLAGYESVGGGILEAADEERRASLQKGDLENFGNLLASLGVLGFTPGEVQNICKVLLGILLLGNISFEPNQPGAAGVQCVGVDPTLPDLLGVHGEDLEAALVRRSVRAGRRTSVSIVPLSMEEAEASRDGLAKALYASLFDWLVERVNTATSLSVSGSSHDKATLFIGILDVFGFEVLQVNSFEQLCINFANEKLQSMFDSRVFALERNILQEQEVEPPQLRFEDNSDLLRLLDSRPNGIFQLLDEQGALGARGTDNNFFMALQSIYGDSNERLVLSKFDASFQIIHFAGPVKYDTAGLVSKNADHLQPDLRDLIIEGTGENDFPRVLLKQPDNNPHRFKVTARSAAAAAEEAELDLPGRPTRKMAKLESVSYIFRAQMNNLEHILDSTDLHFVRCVKPNETKSPPMFFWDAQLILNQLRSLGVLQMIDVRRQGFPVRMDFADLLERYPYLLAANAIEWRPGHNDRPSVVSLLSETLGSDAKNSLFRVGTTKVFMLDDVVRTLDHEARSQRETDLSPEELLAQRLEEKAASAADNEE